MIDLDKHKRQIPLHCPTCGGSNFEHEGVEDTDQLCRCTSCGLEITQADLLQSNGENTEINAEQMVRDALPDIEKHIKKQLEDAFKGNKFIKFK